VHELSIAQSILSIVEKYVPEADRELVRSVKVRVGTQAGIVIDSLTFSFEAITFGSPLAAAKLDVEVVPFSIRCRACGIASTPADGLLLCPACGSGDTEVTGGTEMRVVELELDERAEESP
jgi:hydrogenase nickel incorporation protein HypA/HybF